MDPLNNYYPYPFPPTMGPSDYLYNVKSEPINAQNGIHKPPSTFDSHFMEFAKSSMDIDNGATEVTNMENTVENPDSKEEDSKANIQLLLPTKKGQYKKKGKTSDYWVKKINNKDFPFYGCTICNISFPKIEELDKHVFIHEGRLTSYDIRMYNRKKKKEKLKQMKKMKKLSKALKKEGVKKEIVPLEIEIKPEDGYIGNEKASEYNENKDSNNEPKDGDKKAVKAITKYGETTDPRLHKLFKCFACQKQFSLSYYLRLHVRSHLDEKPYVCSTCGQSFITASKLGRHNKRIHLAIRYQCRICYKNFSRFEMLKNHFDKKHEDAKLPEGEPYDYNAILPYLKELEEQMKQKEMENEKKPKTEDNWTSVPDSSGTLKIEIEVEKLSENNEDVIKKDDMDGNEFKTSDETESTGHVIFGDNPFIFKQEATTEPSEVLEGIVVEEVKVRKEIKTEKEDEMKQDNDTDDSCDNQDDAYNDHLSDEDYMPDSAWAEPPKVEAVLLDVPSPKPKTSKRMKTSEFPRKCEFCEKIIKTKQYYKVHLRIHTGEKPFKCCICDSGFVTRSKMYRHVMTHDNWQEKCKEAEKAEEKIKKEKGEEEEDTKDGKKKRRRRRGKKIKTEVDIKKEKKYGKRPNRCRYCNKTFLHLDTLEVHKKMHEASGDPICLTCFYCLEEQPDEEALVAHESAHSGAKPYICTLCDKAYTAKDPLLNHRSYVHKISTPAGSKEAKGIKRKPKLELICDICSKPFNNEVKLQKHIVSHSVEKYILRYECPVCAHMFHTKYHVQMHLTTHQKEGLILEENRADILAMVLQNARKIPKQGDDTASNMMDLIPPDERSRVCNICGEVFQHFYYLEEHLKSHGSKIAVEDDSKEEERKHICKVCNKGFKLNYYLKLHSYTHVTERPYICQQCGKGFITKGKLKRHIETHSGLKKYQCHICYKFFTRPSYLRIHVRTIHGTQDYNFRLVGGQISEQHSV